MNNTTALFEERKSDVEFYFSILEHIENYDNIFNINDINRFKIILKSNFFLMLYNLEEACIAKAFDELYELINKEKLRYKNLNESLQTLWRNSLISKSFENTPDLSAYRRITKEILDHIVNSLPIELKDVKSPISGNLDARKIRDILDSHSITLLDKKEKNKLLVIKNKRNELAHGEESFASSSCDYTVSDLKEFKDEALNFISDVIISIQKNYQEKFYIAASSKK